MVDRKKWKGIVRQAKAHSELQCQWKKKKNRIRSSYAVLKHKGDAPIKETMTWSYKGKLI